MLYLFGIRSDERNGLWGRTLRSSWGQKVTDTFFSLGGDLDKGFGLFDLLLLVPLWFGLMNLMDAACDKSPCPISCLFELFAIVFMVFTGITRIVGWILAAVLTLPCLLLFTGPIHIISQWIAKPYKALVASLKGENKQANGEHYTFATWLQNRRDQTWDNFGNDVRLEKRWDPTAGKVNKMVALFHQSASGMGAIPVCPEPSMGEHDRKNLFQINISQLKPDAIHAIHKLGLFNKSQEQRFLRTCDAYQKEHRQAAVNVFLDRHFPIPHDGDEKAGIQRDKKVTKKNTKVVLQDAPEAPLDYQHDKVPVLPEELNAKIAMFLNFADASILSRTEKTIHGAAKQAGTDTAVSAEKHGLLNMRHMH